MGLFESGFEVVDNILTGEDVDNTLEMAREDYHDVLSSRKRRDVIRYMEDVSDSAPYGLVDLSTEMAAKEQEKETDEVTSAERKRAYVGLYQYHLPKLDDKEVVEFDKEKGLVREGPNFDIVACGVKEGFRSDDETITLEELS